MADSFYLGAYWGPRPESAEACATRLGGLMSALAARDVALSTWYRKGKSSDERQPVSAAVADVTGLLLAGQHRRDMDNTVMPDLGFRVGLWNGREPSAELSVACGASVDRPQANTVLIRVPAELYRLDLLRAVLSDVVDAWSPDWATVTSHALRTGQKATEGTPVVGWLTYLTTPIEGPLPGSVTVQPYAAGAIVVLAPTAAEVTVADAVAVRQAAGLDRPAAS